MVNLINMPLVTTAMANFMNIGLILTGIWYGFDTTVTTPWKHKNPHDHEGGKDNNGNNTLKSGPLPVDEKFKTPNDTSRSNETSAFGELAGWALLGYGLYKLGKFAFATAIATPTGGLSYVWAAVA